MRIVMLGAPGSGKGTQAVRLASEMNVPHISTGDMLRAAVMAESNLGRQIKEILDRGDLVSDDLVVQAVDERIFQPDASLGFVLDGFPRTIAQAEALDRILRSRNLQLDRVVELEVSDSELVERVKRRAHLQNLESGARRGDDSEEVLVNRLAVYRTQTKPLSDYYSWQNKLCVVPGEGEVNEIFREIMKVLGL